MKYIKLYEDFNTDFDRFLNLSGKSLKILNCDKIKTENGYKIEWEGFHVANIIIDYNVYLEINNSKKEYKFTKKGISSLIADLTVELSKVRRDNTLTLGKKFDIIDDLKKVDIPSDVIKSEFEQNDKNTVISFIERGRPSESYLRKVLKLINKYS